MAFEPKAPDVHYPPQKIAEDTYVIRQMQEAAIGPLWVYLNSMVITGPEPVIVDTGTPANREQWLKDVFTLVPPEEVRWIFLSHDDVDHSGNLAEVLEACPNAKLITSWFMIERHSNCFEFPLDRCVWLNDGESWRAGNRTLTAIQPPLFDSPTTKGLFDDRTGVYWAVDSFAVPLPGPAENVKEVDVGMWRGGLEMFNRMNSPWFKLLDPVKYGQHVDRSQQRDIQVVASCHSPVITGDTIAEAYAILRELPFGPPPPHPLQVDLEELMQCIATGRQYMWQPPAPAAP